MTEVLTREAAIRSLTTPTGRKYKIVHWDENGALFTILSDDSVPGPLPKELDQQLFTSKFKAEEFLKGFLTKFWDISDEVSKKSKQKPQ